jgi:hypothetical protein
LSNNVLQLFTGQFDSPENLFWRRAKIVFHFEPAEDGAGFKFFLKYRHYAALPAFFY